MNSDNKNDNKKMKTRAWKRMKKIRTRKKTKMISISFNVKIFVGF